MVNGSDSRFLRLLNSQRLVDEFFAAAPSPISRADLARRSGLSKPTVSAVVADLEQGGLLQTVGDPVMERGTGRPAVLYELDANAALVVAADIGATTIHIGTADLLGTVLWEEELATPSDAAAATAKVVEIAGRLLASDTAAKARVRWVGIGIPGIYDAESDAVRHAWNLPGFDHLKFRGPIERALGVPVDVDNDVNFAARAETWRGHGRDVDDFVAISISTGIGMGVVIDGALRRGSRAAAGEIGHMQIFAEDASGLPVVETLEGLASAPAILEYVAARSRTETGPVGQPGVTVDEVFQRAGSDPIAAATLRRAADAVARAVAGVCAVLDPQLVVLGGGVGSNSILTGAVQDLLGTYMTEPAQVRASELGSRASFLGAVDAALQGLRKSLVGEVQKR